MSLNCVWSEHSLDSDGRSHYALCTLVNDSLDRAEIGFVHRNGWENLPSGADGAVVIIHGGHQIAEAKALVDQTVRLGWAISVVLGDEEGHFPAHRLPRDSRHKVWVQMPIPGVHDWAERKLICGHPHDAGAFLSLFSEERSGKKLDWFFSGQVNHAGRKACVSQLKMLRGGLLNESPSFWSGLPRTEYYRNLASCKVAPCPSGSATPDTLRVAEALEAGCVPVVEDRWPPFFPRNGQAKTGYWEYVLGEKPPFPTLTDWRDFPALLERSLGGWPENRDRLHGWWEAYKRKMWGWLEEDVRAVRAG